MRVIAVDDEPILVKSFVRQSAGIDGIDALQSFTKPLEALEYAKSNPVDLAFLDIKMPKMNGLDLAEHLREINPEMLIVFVSAYEEYLIDSNKMGADYYLVKPYTKETLQMVMERMKLLSHRQKKRLFVQTFGRFVVYKDGEPLPFTGKAKEILALIITRRGKEISNEEIYSTLWENRPYGNSEMKVYYNALSRLKKALAQSDISNLIKPTTRGQVANTDMFDCDYYDYLDGKEDDRSRFEGEFMSEYSWAEYILAQIAYKDWG